jgi:hypothetical protein
LAASIDHRDGKETILYPCREGKVPNPLSSPDTFARVQGAIVALGDLLQANDIYARDLNASQAMVDSNDGLHVIDTEMYRILDPGTPTLNPGEIVRYQDGQWQQGSDPAYAEPGNPAAARVAPNSLLVCRGGGEGPVLSVRSDGGSIVAVTNRSTNEIAVMHVPVGDQYGDFDDVLSEMVQKAPSLGTPGAVAHVIGDDRAGAVLIVDLTSGLERAGLRNIKQVISRRDTDVNVHSDTCRVAVNDDILGRRVYDYTPPPRVQPQAVTPPPQNQE